MVIYDLKESTCKSFRIEEFLPPEVIENLESATGMRLLRSGWATLDNQGLKLYRSGSTPDPDLPDRPRVVIDIAEMTVRLAPRDGRSDRGLAAGRGGLGEGRRRGQASAPTRAQAYFIPSTAVLP